MIALVVVALAAGAFFLFGGDDDEAASDDTTTTTEEDEETTTTTEGEETTTTTEGEETTTTVAVPGVEFVPLTDATGQLTVEVPPTGPTSPSPDRGARHPEHPGLHRPPGLPHRLRGAGHVLLAAADPAEAGNFDQTLDFLAGANNLPNACVSAGKQDYTDGVFTGRFEVWQECANIGTQIVLIVAAQADGQHHRGQRPVAGRRADRDRAAHRRDVLHRGLSGALSRSSSAPAS